MCSRSCEVEFGVRTVASDLSNLRPRLASPHVMAKTRWTDVRGFGRSGVPEATIWAAVARPSVVHSNSLETQSATKIMVVWNGCS